ncbi:hypothetical protein HDU92_008918 [Lobulomyces angularis]|nr:hypothetical protein HDU92_008918 [Lobulomyces angularis]
MMSTQFLDNTILESKNPKLHAATAYMERILNFKEEKLRESYEAYLNFIKKGLNFDIAINGKLLSLLAKFNRGTEINNIFKKMQKVDIKCVKIVLNYYTRRRDPEYSMKLFNSLPEMGLTPNQHIYYELIRVFANVKDEKQMLHYFNEIKNSLKEEPAIFNYNTVLNFYRENGNYDQIFKFFDDLKKSKVVTPNSYTYAVILNACFDNKKHLLAEKYYKEMLDKGIVPNTLVYEVMLKSYDELGKVQNIKEILTEIKNDKVKFTDRRSNRLKFYSKKLNENMKQEE